jgi:hypothetical protein
MLHADLGGDCSEEMHAWNGRFGRKEWFGSGSGFGLEFFRAVQLGSDKLWRNSWRHHPC